MTDQPRQDDPHIDHLDGTRGGQLVAIRHFPPGELGKQVADIKMPCAELINRIESSCPPGRWRSLAVTAIEEACMWAVKSLTNTPPS